MIRQAVVLGIRNDPAGSGHFGAGRGSRRHTGVDYACSPGDGILSPVEGTVSKLGYCYADDLSWRYVQVTDHKGRRHRLFYVQPSVSVGDEVTPGSVVGDAQDITLRYPGQGMLPHVHYEIKTDDGEYVNPEGPDA